MKVISIYYPDQYGRVRLPKEDAWAIDKTNKIFAVADGVHLRKGIEYKNKYPRPSPAGRLAQKFCDVFVKEAKRGGIKNAFKKANLTLFAFNKNRDKYSVLENAGCYYAATASFMMVRGKYLEYGNICDSGVAAVDTKGKLLIRNCDQVYYDGFSLSKYSAPNRVYLSRTIFRNAIDKHGKKRGYGVVTGEKEAEKYVRYGRTRIIKGNIYLLSTDGFEFYLGNAAFRKALASFDKKKIEAVVGKIMKETKNVEFKKEKTLVAVRF